MNLVKTLRSLAFPLLLVGTCFVLSGCGGNWLVGKWTLDKERTIEAMGQETTASQNEPGKGLLKDIVGGLQKGLSRVLLSQLEGTSIEFTNAEIRRISEGSGDAQDYEIIEKPDPDTYLVKYADGEIVTWSRVEGGIRLKMGGEPGAWIYFQPEQE